MAADRGPPWTTAGAMAALLSILGAAACANDSADRVGGIDRGLRSDARPSDAGNGAGGEQAAGAEHVPRSVEAPPGMVYVPGGTARIGSDDGFADEMPAFRVDVAPFFLDRHLVTVAQFGAFVQATGFMTQAERFGDAGVYDPTTGGWRLVQGASWRFPLGPGGPAAEPDHPVTQVSWNDAVAYADWAGKRLPTEIEWEYAARAGATEGSRYAWGDQLVVAGEHRANTWQGAFPGRNTAEDGYRFTSPVGAFGETSLGLTDMGGNVWEWTASWYRPYAERNRPYRPDARSEKVQRGGSFLCHPSYCHGYRVSARSHATPETALFHVGFRLAADPPAP